MTKYVVLGAGIIGFYTVFNLIDKGVNPEDITIISKFWPGDESIEYTSPYAGGNYSCITGDDLETIKFDRRTYENLGRLQKLLGGGKKSGLDLMPSWENWETKPADHKIASLKSYLMDYEEAKEAELPEGASFGIKFTTWNFNCPKFLKRFEEYLVNEKGVKTIRQELTHISQAFLHDTKVVFNCTGLGALKLGGVEDTKVYPTRGQVVVIKAPHIQEDKFLWTSEAATYIIKRPHSNDQLILGGYLQKDNWSSATYRDETADILQRTTKLLPKILAQNANGSRIEDLEILRVVSGLRPSRHGGVRVEKENLDEGKSVVHNYGASGYGYQAGFGMAEKAVILGLGREYKL